MNIQNLTRENSYKGAIIELNYDEIRCICNSLYEISKISFMKKERDFNNVYKSFIELFALVKHGFIPDFELESMYKLLLQTSEERRDKKS